MQLELEVKLSFSTMRGEMAGDAIGRMASDLKLAGPVLIDKLLPLFKSDAEFHAALGSKYDPETDDLICTQLKPLELEREFEKCTAELNTAVGTKATLQVFGDATLKNFKFQLKPGRCVEFTATLQVYPSDPQWSIIANWREKTLNVHCGGGEIVQPKAEAQGKLAVAVEQPPASKKKAKKGDPGVERLQ